MVSGEKKGIIKNPIEDIKMRGAKNFFLPYLSTIFPRTYIIMIDTGREIPNSKMRPNVVSDRLKK